MSQITKKQIERFVRECYAELSAQFKPFKLYAYVKRKQQDFSIFVRQIVDAKTIAVQLGYAENYSSILWDEIQSAHRAQNQCSVFTAHTSMDKKDEQWYTIVSDHLLHASVHKYSDILHTHRSHTPALLAGWKYSCLELELARLYRLPETFQVLRGRLALVLKNFMYLLKILSRMRRSSNVGGWKRRAIQMDGKELFSEPIKDLTSKHYGDLGRTALETKLKLCVYSKRSYLYMPYCHDYKPAFFQFFVFENWSTAYIRVRFTFEYHSVILVR